MSGFPDLIQPSIGRDPRSVSGVDLLSPPQPGAEPFLEVTPTPKLSGLALVFRITGDRRLFRLAPLRDPREPRFWGLAVYPCLESGLQEPGPPIWAGCWGSPRNDLKVVLDNVQDNIDRWMSGDQCHGLRTVLSALPPAAPDRNANKPAAKATVSSVNGASVPRPVVRSND